MKQLPSQVPVDEDCQVFSQASSDVPVATPARINRVNLALLFAAAVLYSAAVGGAIEILGAFVMKEPLSWSATQVTFGCLCVYFVLVVSNNRVLVLLVNDYSCMYLARGRFMCIVCCFVSLSSRWVMGMLQAA